MDSSSDYNSNSLREAAIKMATVVESLLDSCIQKEKEFNDLFTLEEQINQFHKNIDDQCFKYLALRHPAATDLRITISVMKINAELERIGDQSISIKRYFDRLQMKNPRIENMKRIVQRMLKRGLDSFVYLNAQKAIDVIQTDREVNEIHREIVEEVLTKMRNNQITFEEGYSLIKIAKNFERIGDNTTNIAEAVVFIQNGFDIRHTVPKELDTDKTNKESFDQFLSKMGKGRENYFS